MTRNIGTLVGLRRGELLEVGVGPLDAESGGDPEHARDQASGARERGTTSGSARRWPASGVELEARVRQPLLPPPSRGAARRWGLALRRSGASSPRRPPARIPTAAGSSRRCRRPGRWRPGRRRRAASRPGDCARLGSGAAALSDVPSAARSQSASSEKGSAGTSELKPLAELRRARPSGARAAESLELGALLGVDPGNLVVRRRCCDDDDSVDEVRVAGRESQRDATAGRPARDADPFDVQRVEHRRDVVRGRAHRRPPFGGHGIRAPVSGPVDREQRHVALLRSAPDRDRSCRRPARCGRRRRGRSPFGAQARARACS